MKIERNTTANFGDYLVVRRTQTWWQRLLGIRSEEELSNVLECDDTTGRLVQQVTLNSCPVYTNGAGEDIVIDNTAKILMLNPAVRQSLLLAGFVPKTTTTFEKNIRIIYRNPASAIDSIEQKLEVIAEITNNERDQIDQRPAAVGE